MSVQPTVSPKRAITDALTGETIADMSDVEHCIGAYDAELLAAKALQALWDAGYRVKKRSSLRQA